MRTKNLVLASIILLSMVILLLVCKGSKEVSKTEIEKIKEPETYNYRVVESDKSTIYSFEYNKEPRLDVSIMDPQGHMWEVITDESQVNKALSVLGLPPVPPIEKGIAEDEYYAYQRGEHYSTARTGRNEFTWKNYPLGILNIEARYRYNEITDKWDEYCISRIILRKK